MTPNQEYVEYAESYVEKAPPITKGMSGRINIILPNGQYHVEIIDDKTSETIAYVPVDEEFLEKVED